MVPPASLILIPMLFLVAGLLSPAVVGAQGSRAYARGRLLRLGVPFVVFVLLLRGC